MHRPITRREFNDVLRRLKEALRLASTHDPEHELRLGTLEQQMRDLNAPEYRVIQKGSHVSRRRR